MSLPTEQAPPAPTSKDANITDTATKDQLWIAILDLILRLVVAAVCNTLAGRTSTAMTASKPWWLGHASGLAIRFLGVKIVNESKISEGYRNVLQLLVFALGWALDSLLVQMGSV